MYKPVVLWLPVIPAVHRGFASGFDEGQYSATFSSSLEIFHCETR